ncbi:MAG: hypothetical protein AAFQ37_06665 [Bacteroidota bacterium]
MAITYYQLDFITVYSLIISGLLIVKDRRKIRGADAALAFTTPTSTGPTGGCTTLKFSNTLIWYII